MDSLARGPEDRRAGRVRPAEVSAPVLQPDSVAPPVARPVAATKKAAQKTPMPAPAQAKPAKRKFNFLDTLEKPIEVIIRICGWSSIIGIAAIFLFIFKEAAPMVPKLNWFHFFTSPRWIPNPA